MSNKEITIFALQLFMVVFFIELMSLLPKLLAEYYQFSLGMPIIIPLGFAIISIAALLIALNVIKRMAGKIILMPNSEEPFVAGTLKNFDVTVISLIGLYYMLDGFLSFVYNVYYYEDESLLFFLAPSLSFLGGLVLMFFAKHIAKLLKRVRN